MSPRCGRGTKSWTERAARSESAPSKHRPLETASGISGDKSSARMTNARVGDAAGAARRAHPTAPKDCAVRDAAPAEDGKPQSIHLVEGHGSAPARWRGRNLREGAVAYIVARRDQGLKQMMEQVNLSRLSQRARGGEMQRCVNEGPWCAAHQAGVGNTISDYPCCVVSSVNGSRCRPNHRFRVPCSRPMQDRASRRTRSQKYHEDPDAALKFRACRDKIPVATGRWRWWRQRLHRGMGQPGGCAMPFGVLGKNQHINAADINHTRGSARPGARGAAGGAGGNCGFRPRRFR